MEPGRDSEWPWKILCGQLEIELTYGYQIVEGEILAVKTWHLRPTLIWKEEKWVRWFSSVRENDSSSQGPPAKKLKLGIPETEGKQNEITSEKIEVVEPKKSSESRLTPLSTNEKLFKNGKRVRGKNFTDLQKTAQTNCQEEGSKVLSGVPNPGKMKNLTEVTKRNTKTNESGDSQKSGSCGPKTVSKDDMKAKLEASYKARVDRVPRSQPLRNKDLTSGSSILNDDSLKESRVVSSLGPSKKFILSKVKTEQVSERKPIPYGGKCSQVETRDKPDNGNVGQSVSEVVELRRSNRKVQPTSRLLEGLETLIMTTSKHVVSHDTSRPSQHKASLKDSGIVTK